MRRHNWSGRRTLLGDGRITLVGWPSRGGVIVLEWADIVDFTFLGLDRHEPPLQRATNQAEENDFCQRLLLLGAKWFDSTVRWEWFDDVESGDEVACNQLEMEEVPEPTLSERRWVKVGWSTDANGGFWVAEYDNGMNYGLEEWSEQLCPTELPGLLMLCHDMEERCKVLKAFGAKFYGRLDDYNGSGFLKAWGEEHLGEVDSLVKTNSE